MPTIDFEPIFMSLLLLCTISIRRQYKGAFNGEHIDFGAYSGLLGATSEGGAGIGSVASDSESAVASCRS